MRGRERLKGGLTGAKTYNPLPVMIESISINEGPDNKTFQPTLRRTRSPPLSIVCFHSILNKPIQGEVRAKTN